MKTTLHYQLFYGSFNSYYKKGYALQNTKSYCMNCEWKSEDPLKWVKLAHKGKVSIQRVGKTTSTTLCKTERQQLNLNTTYFLRQPAQIKC